MWLTLLSNRRGQNFPIQHLATGCAGIFPRLQTYSWKFTLIQYFRNRMRNRTQIHCRLSFELMQIFRKVQRFSSFFRKYPCELLNINHEPVGSQNPEFPHHRLKTGLQSDFMSYRTLYEVVPLVSSGILRSTSTGRPCRSFSAMARAFANTYSLPVHNDPWSFDLTPLEDMMFSHPITLRNTARSMRQMVG